MSVGRRIARALARVGRPHGLAPAGQRVVYDEVATWHDGQPRAVRTIVDVDRERGIVTYEDTLAPFRKAREANYSLEPVAHIIKAQYEYLDREEGRYHPRSGEQIMLDALLAELTPEEP